MNQFLMRNEKWEIMMIIIKLTNGVSFILYTFHISLPHTHTHIKQDHNVDDVDGKRFGQID